MDVTTFDELLKTLADGETIDYEQWPALQSRIITRLERVSQVGLGPDPVAFKEATSSFELPSSPAEPSQVTETSSQKSSSSNDKENAPPPNENSSSKPPHIAALLKSIISTLNTHFTKYPPHTIQRLAELTIDPKQHYKTLNSYLHAVDRVVHVTSGANTFPLPPAIPDPSSAAVLSNGGALPTAVSWGNPAGPQPNGLGSDESLGGALLTPILWLNRNLNGNSHSPLEGEVKTESTEMIDGPNGLGGIETVTVSVNGISSTRGDSSGSPPNVAVNTNLRAEGGVTQGELLRQEQRAGVVPVRQLPHLDGDADGMGEEDESPHARGPEEIGMEDMGPQSLGSSERGGPNMGMQGIDVEAALGRKVEPLESSDESVPSPPGTPKREAEEELESPAKRAKEDEDSAMDEDTKETDEKVAEIIDTTTEQPDTTDTEIKEDAITSEIIENKVEVEDVVPVPKDEDTKMEDDKE